MARLKKINDETNNIIVNNANIIRNTPLSDFRSKSLSNNLP